MSSKYSLLKKRILLLVGRHQRYPEILDVLGDINESTYELLWNGRKVDWVFVGE